jgi:hypothetical protein
VVLASYEPAETSLTLTSPDVGMTLTWPVAGGVSGVPAATEGSNVLKMDWVGEVDRKVEVKHTWTGSTFDLSRYSEIQVDVYVDTASALHDVVGIWDDVFGWTAGYPVAAPTGTWVTVSMCVNDVDYSGLDHIFALLFEQLAGDDGRLYLDNLRVVGPRQVAFAGYDWTVKCGNPAGPGPNHFSTSPLNVWVDGLDKLHLKVAKRDGEWFSSEVVGNDSLGYGRYIYTVESQIDLLDPNLTLGLFTWDTFAPAHNYREIDFEFGRWKIPSNDNAQFVVQPWSTPGNRHRFDIVGSGPTTHVMKWSPGGIEFISYKGSYTPIPAPLDIIETWSYAGSDNPPAGGESARMNLWQVDGLAPSDGLDAEMVISHFQFIPQGPRVPVAGIVGAVALALGLLGTGSFIVRKARHRE